MPPDGLHLGDPAVQSVASSCPECRQASRLGNAAPMRCLEGLVQSLCSPEDLAEQQERHREAMAKLGRDEAGRRVLQWDVLGRYFSAGQKCDPSMGCATPIMASLAPPMAFGMGGTGAIMFF